MPRFTVIFSSVTALAVLFLAPATFGETSGLASRHLLDQGKSFYQRGDHVRAAQALSKVLLMEPENREALLYLKKMGLDGSYYGNRNQRFSQIVHLAEKVQDYELRLKEMQAQSDKKDELARTLENDKEALRQAVAAMEDQTKDLRQKMEDVHSSSEHDQAMIADLEKNVSKKDEEIERLNTNLIETRDQLNEHLALLSSKEEELKKLELQTQDLEKDLSSTKNSWRDNQMEYENRIQAIEEELGGTQHARATSEEEFQGQLRTLKEALDRKVSELTAAQEQMIFVEYKLNNREKQLNERVRQVDDLKNTMTELEQNLTAMQQKNSEDMPGPASDVKDPSEAVKEHRRWIKRQDFLIAKLKDKLLSSREQMESLGESGSGLNDSDVVALREELLRVKQRLQQNHSAPGESEEFLLMEQRFKDAQERLEAFEKILQERDDQVKELEEQLNSALSP